MSVTSQGYTGYGNGFLSAQGNSATSQQRQVPVTPDAPLVPQIFFNGVNVANNGPPTCPGSPACCPEETYRIYARDEAAKIQKETDYAHWIRTHESPPGRAIVLSPGRFIEFALHPGESANEDATVSTLYDLAPGRYLIQVERDDELTRMVVKSNVITVTVTK